MRDVDIVVHAAAALPLASPTDIFSTAVRGTRLLLGGALSRQVRRFIFISSTAVYGIPDHHPLQEGPGVSHRRFVRTRFFLSPLVSVPSGSGYCACSRSMSSV